METLSNLLGVLLFWTVISFGFASFARASMPERGDNMFEWFRRMCFGLEPNDGPIWLVVVALTLPTTILIGIWEWVVYPPVSRASRKFLERIQATGNAS
ncbi:MAG: hypothetical protein HZB70_01185 [Candidatus Berkelbacteria bacterium]|nr:MAG: hypothetical protein HZB70_01185 [Candidatus Berkelbacteria bacterium]QQG52047.1 MAG: hypothetical protein HY845_01810 [Candidatus Berkelbacteria bacterium]